MISNRKEFCFKKPAISGVKSSVTNERFLASTLNLFHLFNIYV